MFHFRPMSSTEWWRDSVLFLIFYVFCFPICFLFLRVGVYRLPIPKKVVYNGQLWKATGIEFLLYTGLTFLLIPSHLNSSRWINYGRLLGPVLACQIKVPWSELWVTFCTQHSLPPPRNTSQVSLLPKLPKFWLCSGVLRIIISCFHRQKGMTRAGRCRLEISPPFSPKYHVGIW